MWEPPSDLPSTGSGSKYFYLRSYTFFMVSELYILINPNAMKIREGLVLLICTVFLSVAGMAQCGTIHKISYDTTVTSGGSAYPGYNFVMPKFNPALGTLTNVNVSSVVTLAYSYTVENDDTKPHTTKVRIERTDTIIGPTATDTLANDYYTLPRSFPQAASNGVPGSGPDFNSVPQFYIFNKDTLLNHNFPSVAPYLGGGTVSFRYSNDVGQQTNGNPNSNIQGQAKDTIKFSISYTYCDNIILASDITAFSATKKDGHVSLLWVTTNELPNHPYELQKSVDGKDFVAIATVPSRPNMNGNGSYEYNYEPLSHEADKLYFRIKQVINGVLRYTPVRVVDLGDTGETKTTIKLVPNPSNGVFTIVVANNPVATDWNIELFNLKGQVIDKKQVANTTLAKFPMSKSLSPGVYFILVTDRKNSRKFVERMIVN